MAYCTNTELTSLTGTGLSTDIQDAIISQADREINARLENAGIGIPSSDDSLKSASLNLSKVGIITYDRMKGNRPSDLKVGEISMSDNLDAAIKKLTEMAWESVDSYISSHGTSTRDKQYLRKVNR